MDMGTLQEETIVRLKDLLTTTPVLAQPDLEGAQEGTNPYIIYTDASQRGVGAILCQKGEDESVHPIYFASKQLSKAERNYHVTDMESLALVFVLKKFHSCSADSFVLHSQYMYQHKWNFSNIASLSNT